MRAWNCSVLLTVLIVPSVWAQAPVGDEFRVHENIDRAQRNSASCMDATGRVFFVWEQDFQIWGRNFGSSGVPTSPSSELTVPSSPPYGHRPRCESNAWGEGAAVWAGGPPALVALRPIELGVGALPETFSLWSDLAFSPGNASVSVRADGTRAVSWVTSGSTLSLTDVWVRTIGLDGSLGPGPIRAQQDGGYNSSYPTETDVAWLDSGRLVVVWNAPGADLDQDGVLARIFDANGNPEGPAFLVNTYEIDLQVDPEVDSDSYGNFTVVWDSFWQDGSGEGIFAQRFDHLGQKLGNEMQVSSNAYSGQYEPSISIDWAGNSVVSFSSIQEENHLREDTFVKAYRADGSTLGEQLMVNQQIIYEQDVPSVSLSDSGTFVVSWHSHQVNDLPLGADPDVMERRFTLPCLPGPTTLCLLGDRFLVRALYETAAGGRGFGEAIPLTSGSGGFWFFWPDNFELLVKVVDGCNFNRRFWLFAAGLTDVKVDLIVTDTWTGTVQTWRSTLGEPFAPVQQIERFATCDAPRPVSFAAGATSMARPLATSMETDLCSPDTTHLCLNDGRFRVGANWRAFDGRQGIATAAPLAGDSGLFWFFAPEILELAIKVIDGCQLNDRFWVYTAGLTNVEVDLTVEDLLRNRSWSFHNPAGQAFPPILDSSALDTCP